MRVFYSGTNADKERENPNGKRSIKMKKGYIHKIHTKKQEKMTNSNKKPL